MAKVRIDDYVRNRDEFLRKYVNVGDVGACKGRIIQQYMRLEKNRMDAKSCGTEACESYSRLRMTI